MNIYYGFFCYSMEFLDAAADAAVVFHTKIIDSKDEISANLC